MTQARLRKLLGAAHVFTGALVLGGIWIALPARFLPMDLAGSVFAAVCLASGVGLLRGKAWGLRVSRVVSWVTLSVGLAITSALAATVTHLAGSYGPVGDGGALLMSVIVLLIAPYLVGLPLLQLSWVRRAQ